MTKKFDDLKEAIIHLELSQNQSIQSQTSISEPKIIRPIELAEMLYLRILTICRMYNEGHLPPKVKISSHAVRLAQVGYRGVAFTKKGKLMRF